MLKKISVITGGHGGMGKAIACELGENYTLVLAGRNEEKMTSAKKEMEELGYEVFIFKVDIQDQQRVNELAAFAASLGEVVNVIHTSGVSPADTGAEVILSINAMGTLYLTNAFYPVLSEGGVMINFASVAAYTIEASDEWYEVFDTCEAPEFYEKLKLLTDPFKDDAFVWAGIAYCLSKRFVIYFSQKNTVRFADKGCRILSISPGSYLTPMHQKLIDNQPETAEMQKESIPLDRWGRPYEIAALVVFLCSKGAGFLSGVDILADGGQIANTFVEQLK
ncbi:SDR family oxidoreductase [Eubacteriaceae bacterium ES2]|nr:SDR family oxidoreductase [Eubacteriaceae bacterium ES2]